MTDLLSSTIVTFPDGQIEASSTVVHDRRADGLDPKATSRAVFAEVTLFHPADHAWSDQPGDTGVLLTELGTLRVTGSVTAAVPREGGDFLLDTDFPVKRGDPKYAWFVCHLVSETRGNCPSISSARRSNFKLMQSGDADSALRAPRAT